MPREPRKVGGLPSSFLANFGAIQTSLTEPSWTYRHKDVPWRRSNSVDLSLRFVGHRSFKWWRSS